MTHSMDALNAAVTAHTGAQEVADGWQSAGYDEDGATRHDWR